MRFSFFIAMMITAASSTAHADFADGNMIYAACRNDPALVTGYVIGVWDAEKLHSYAAPNFCPHGRVTSEQLKDIVCKDYADHPRDRSDAAYLTLVGMFAEAFPCTDDDTREAAKQAREGMDRWLSKAPKVKPAP